MDDDWKCAFLLPRPPQVDIAHNKSIAAKHSTSFRLPGAISTPHPTNSPERDRRHLEDAAERRRTFRKLEAPELLPAVGEGVTFIDGVRVQQPSVATADEKTAA